MKKYVGVIEICAIVLIFLTILILIIKDYPTINWAFIATIITSLLMLFVSCRMVRISEIANQISKNSNKLFEQSLNLERPWLVIEKVRVERREGAPIQPEMINNWYISFIWKNIGRMPAVIEKYITKIENKNDLPETPDYTNASKHGHPCTVAAGIDFETNQFGPAPQKRTENGEVINLTVYGKLTYKELNGQLHETGFAVDVSPHLPASSTSKNKSYEYYT